MHTLQSSKSDEKNQRTEQEIEISKDYSKARQFHKSIVGRCRLRAMRKFLWKLNINLIIPCNSAYITDKYCQKYNKEEEKLFLDLL